jgi:hypothetical protein
MVGVRGVRTWKRWRAPLPAVLVGVVCAIVGLALLWHPIAGWPYGAPHRSDVPPILGVGVLAVPVILLGIAVWKVWDRVALEVQLRFSRRKGRRHN